MKCILSLFSLLILGHFLQANAQLSQAPYWGTSFILPTKVEAEDYDKGGQGIAYNDTDVSNQGNVYRTDGVDVEVCSEGGYNVGYMASGEWLEYSIEVKTTGNYKLDLRTASGQSGCVMRVDIDEIAITNNIALPNTAGWQNWITTSLTGISLSAGQHILRVFIVAGGFNLNYLDFTTVINKLPVVSISAPSNGTTFTAPASFSLNANASDADGTVTKVEFYSDKILLGTALTAPYSFYWSNIPEGTYTVSAKATDNLGATTLSTAVTLVITTIVAPNQLPSIALTAPLNNSIANAPTNVTISAEAKDADGAIARVEFYNGTVLLGIDNVAPYSYVWTGVGTGVYSITAKAIDNLGASKISSPALMTVLAAVTDICVGVAAYIENANYVAGSKVKNNNGLYECRPWPFSGWCNGADWAYAPGFGAYWTDAWTFTGSCGNTRASENNTEPNSAVLTIFPNPFLSSAMLSVVVKESDQMSLKLYDKNGQYLKTIAEDYFVAGSYQFPLNLEGERTGIYQVKCITHSDSKIIRIQKAE